MLGDLDDLDTRLHRELHTEVSHEGSGNEGFPEMSMKIFCCNAVPVNAWLMQNLFVKVK